MSPSGSSRDRPGPVGGERGARTNQSIVTDSDHPRLPTSCPRDEPGGIQRLDADLDMAGDLHEWSTATELLKILISMVF